MSISDKFDRSSVLEAPLPFRVKASFKAMYQYWEDLAKGDDADRARYAQKVLDSVAHAKEIHEPFDDFALLDRYEKEIARLFAPVFPAPLKDNEIKAVSLPFRHFFFNPTPRLKRILDATDNDYHLMVRDMHPDTMYIFASIFLLNVIYKAGIEYKRPFYFEIPNKQDGITRYYRAFFNGDFAEFHPNPEAPELTAEDINLLRDNFDNIDLWKEKIPPNSYDFEGFGLVTLFDVTADESLSDMKNILLQGNVLQSTDNLKRLESDLRSYLNTSDVRLGLATYDAR
ncbi:MAG: hypothetical protein R3301_15205, partial [Saprospiraceae bacterium]|nr:hypothetical protein [Saprospiraceae bacterium]